MRAFLAIGLMMAADFDSVRSPPIFSGDLDASLLIINQAPGLTEYEQQSPFFVSSGNRLFSWLQLAKGAATPDNIDRIQAAVFRAQALQNAIRTQASQGHKAHTWLTAKEAQQLLEACKRRTSGKPEFRIFTMRDRLAIGLMMAAGLRREEAVSLRFEDVKKQHERTVLDVEGKGAKDRVVPINQRLAEAILDWEFLVGPDGFVLRSLGRNKQPGESISTTALYDIVQKRGALIGKPDLQPHDLRRTYAELGRRAGVPIEQISILLGHANIKTTQEYLNIELDLEVTISDFVPF